MILCTLSLSFVAATAAPLQSLPISRQLLDRHLRTVYAERTEAFLARWADADEEDRARIEALFAELRSPYRSRVAPPDLRTVSIALRAFENESPDELEQLLTGLVDSLDLAVVPGVFEPSPKGTLLEVRVRTLFDSTPASVSFSLVWISPEGEERRGETQWISPEGEERRGETREVEASAFTRVGFKMDIRSPEEGLGTWHLAAEAEIDGRRARSLPIPVECVDRFGERLHVAIRKARMVPIKMPKPGETQTIRSADALSAARTHSHWATAVETLVETGQRGPVGPGGMLGLLERPVEPSGPTQTPRLARPAYRIGDVMGWAVEWIPEGEIDWVLLLLVPTTEDPEWILSGTVGRGWREFASRERCMVVASRVPTPFGGKNASLEAFIRNLCGDVSPRSVPVYALARGDAVLRLSIGVARGAAPFAGMILVSESYEPSGEWNLSGVPVLLIDSGEVSDAERPYELSHVSARKPWLLNELDLPDIVSRWIGDPNR